MSAEVIPITKPKANTYPEYLSPELVEEEFPGLTTRKLADMRSAGKGPAYFKPSPKTVLYDRADLHRYVAATRNPTRDIY